METLENNVKKYITSLLTSTPLVVTIQQLGKDYRNTIGEAIPYQKLGYNSLEHLLRSIPDTVHVKGVGATAVVTPVVSEKSAHINKLVTSQKVTTKKKHSFIQKRNTFFPPTNYRQPPIQNVSTPIPQRKMFYPAKKEVTPAPTAPPPSIPNYNTKPQSDKPANYSSEPVNNVDVSPFTYTCKNDCARPVKKTNLLGSTRPFGDSNDLDESINTSLTTTGKRCKPKRIFNNLDRVTENDFENNVPSHVRNNLRTLIRCCPEGIWCSQVPYKYREMFRKELDYNDLGFKSLIHLCTSLPSIFHYVRPSNEDYKLYDRSRPLPECAEKNFTMASYGSGSTIKNSTEMDNGSSALPALEWGDVKKFLPADIFMPGKEIPRTFVSHDVKENDTLDVRIGEIYDLSKFWVYKADMKLDRLMDEIQDFYTEHAPEYAIPDHLIREGIYCVQVIFGEYHRALIVDTMPHLEDTIRVVFIDYGTMTKVSSRGLCFLHKRFSELEAQAIRCRLANVFPLEEGAPWSREACKAFRRLVMDRDVTAKINHINWEDQFLEVYLADVTEEDQIFYINDRLVEQGYALQPNKERKQALVDPIYTPIVKFIHLFPTFSELEHGMAPSTEEMDVFHECNLPLNFCYPQYFYVDHSREEHIIKAAEAFHEANCVRDRRRTPTSRFFDLEQYKAPVPDLSIFGDLRQEIAEFMSVTARYAPPEVDDDDDFADADEAVSETAEDCTVKTEPPDVSAKDDEAVKVLKEDLKMAEDIMNDIQRICLTKKQCDGNGSSSEGSSASETSMKHPLSALTFGEEGLRLPDVHLTSHNNFPFSEDLPLLNRLKIETEHRISNFIDNELFSDMKRPLTEVEEEEENGNRGEEEKENRNREEEEENKNLGEEEENRNRGEEEDYVASKKEEEEVVLKSTNPFLQDITDGADDVQGEVLRLNPNNPFLTYIRETGNGSSGESSSSTAYESPVVTRPQQSWSTCDDVPAATISELCSESGSSDSLVCYDHQTCSTQTGTYETGAASANYPLPGGYPDWTDANPYYSMRVANFQGFLCESQLVARRGMPPPPGFLPNQFAGYRPPFGIQGYAQGVPMGYVPQTFNIQLQVHPAVANSFTQLAAFPGAGPVAPQAGYGMASESSFGTTSGSMDFYDVYNEQLRQRMGGGGQ